MGLLKRDEEPTPSTYPEVPDEEPANVVAKALDIKTCLITLLAISAINRFPLVSAVSLVGCLNFTAVPTPLVRPAAVPPLEPPPTSHDTTPLRLGTEFIKEPSVKTKAFIYMPMGKKGGGGPRRHTLLHNHSDTVIRWIGNIESIGPNGEAGRSVESGEIA